MVMTAAQIADAVRRTFGDESSVQVTDQDILRWINAAQREITSRNNILKGVATSSITAGTNEYVLDGIPLLKVHSLQVNGMPIDNRSFQTAEDYIIKNDPKREGRGSPILWYRWGQSIYFWPTPAEDSLDGLRIYYIASPAEVTSLQDSLALPDEYFNRILEYVMAQAYELDEDAQSHIMKLQQFADNMTAQEGDSDRPQAETYGVITVRPEDDWYYG